MMAPPNPTDEELTQQLHLLKSQLNKKQTFETSLNSLKTLLISTYPSSSPPLRTLFYDVVCRVATVLRTRYTFPHYLSSGLDLLLSFHRLALDPAHRSRALSLISDIQQTLISQQQGNAGNAGNAGNGGYLFEGHLTVDPEPPQPDWLVQQNLLTAIASSGGGNIDMIVDALNNGGNTSDNNAESLMMRLVETLELGGEERRRIAPPASKEVVEKLPVVKVGHGDDRGECCICKEKLVAGDEMQEMPCKHLFHPLCLKPWLDEHNSCPICRHELPTDDHGYESWKEREKELEEERRGAANAVREGEYMYV